MITENNEIIAVVGLGYVGLPLALALAEYYTVVGVDTNHNRIADLKQGVDSNHEIASSVIGSAKQISYSTAIADAKHCTVFIVTAPTPIDADYQPDLTLLKGATSSVATVFKKGDMVVFESTVCPGTTDDVCIPMIEAATNLRVNDDFHCAYSPERLSPSDKRLQELVKIISASNVDGLKRIRMIYQKIITAGLYEAQSLKIAEAAKITENIQRDVDIAITNELAMLFNRMGIDSSAVFDAAASKWNFRRFYPGLVGGHCIGVDPYYLLEHARQKGYDVPILEAARQVNNAVPHHVAKVALQLLKTNDKVIQDCKVLILGYSFKENCSDVRNTLVETIRQDLQFAGCQLTVCDPVADVKGAKELYNVDIKTDLKTILTESFDLILFAVAHDDFKNINPAVTNGVLVVDVKGIAARADWVL